VGSVSSIPREHGIILNLDNNEDYYLSAGSIHPLSFDTNRMMVNQSHDDSLCTLAITCGLVDVLAEQHSLHPFRPTYIRGKKRIDYMLVLAHLQHAVERSGILPYHAVFSGNHHPCFLDFNAAILFSGFTSPLPPPCQRSFQLSDPRQDREVLYDQLNYHYVFDKSKVLSEAASTNQWLSNHTSQYELLDQTIITQAMLFAKQSCSKRYTKRFEWSPKHIQLVEAVRYWRLLLKRSKRLPIKPSRIQRAKDSAGLSLTQETISIPHVISGLCKALILVRLAQKSHRELREAYLMGLAEAIAVEKRPHLANDPYDSFLFGNLSVMDN